MRILFIGDIVGKPGRVMVKHHLPIIKQKEKIDIVIANYENVSHGYGMIPKNYKELKNSGVDIFTGGNHSFDKKEIIKLLQDEPIIRPANMYDETPGKGVFINEDYKLAVISLMGQFGMPIFENPFRKILGILDTLKGYNIFVDFHAESTAEKRAMYLLIKDKICGLVGTHTHIGTDDLLIDKSVYLTDIGLTGCFDNVIGMGSKEPIERFLRGFSKSFDVVDKCKKIFQALVMDIKDNKCLKAYKIKAYDFDDYFISQRIESNKWK